LDFCFDITWFRDFVALTTFVMKRVVMSALKEKALYNAEQTKWISNRNYKVLRTLTAGANSLPFGLSCSWTSPAGYLWHYFFHNACFVGECSTSLRSSSSTIWSHSM